MKHCGDITELNGRELEPVEVVIGGSPCQDLSIAGKRAGLSGERSGLFGEQIRIIKEMRERDRGQGRADTDIRPRYMVWENVPGAFSSNGGEDFRAVLEQTAQIADETAVIPRPPKRKWRTAGCIMGDGWSIAWRVLDAQFWGVPQRRRRIALIADLGGQSAPEILFERESLSGGPAESGAQGENAAPAIGTDTAETSLCYCLQGNGIDRADTAGCNGRGWKEGVSYTLNTIDRHAVCADMSHANDVIREHGGIAPSLQARMGTGGNQVPLVYALDRASFNCGINAQYGMGIDDSGNNPTLTAQGPSAVATNIVRRLTPLECERLQGFPDAWTDIGDWVDGKGKNRRTTDTARYKAIGNSIAVPPWRYVLSRLNVHLKEHTMGSLFDGIGGFPLVWHGLNGSGKCLWASEIEPFCIAVTQKRFAELEQRTL